MMFCMDFLPMFLFLHHMFVSIILEVTRFSLLPFRKDPEPEVIYLRHVERAHHPVKSEEEEGPTQAPKFTHPLRDLDIVEGTRAHFEATVVPVGDPTMQLEWLVNGSPIPASELPLPI